MGQACCQLSMLRETMSWWNTGQSWGNESAQVLFPYKPWGSDTKVLTRRIVLVMQSASDWDILWDAQFLCSRALAGWDIRTHNHHQNSLPVQVDIAYTHKVALGISRIGLLSRYFLKSLKAFNGTSYKAFNLNKHYCGLKIIFWYRGYSHCKECAEPALYNLQEGFGLRRGCG